jgi:hypothetical protein
MDKHDAANRCENVNVPRNENIYMTYYQRKQIFVPFILVVCCITYFYPYRSLSPVIIRVWSVLHNIDGQAETKKTAIMYAKRMN